ncbi:ArsR/SmtB family transcription factor [Pseudomonas typographi]|uniref:Helix-turn-helix transcriptional regulator n=1 Tax=Pseudomonas typographi TaxID=2715964 RepID=A0ABR7YWA6_9PSED|nr:helix-turn-helix transcriptional regulator [Pseudomonas typographi]MBD1552512.1 helix-turn-helix transcriptional regulator [Pseudomonas typographi]MBD1585602.1 helix-turn-helix transcriptional regulator [Pseudomonas typographi]MBD1597484.1 helix-turn-helix transcriptional regulator [Pseudomonas typographi]
MPDPFDAIFKALAHPLRREILAWLKDPAGNFPEQSHSYEHGICAGQIDQRCGVAQSTVSAHLATLQRAGLVTSHKVGQWHLFKRDEAALAQFLDQLSRRL